MNHGGKFVSLRPRDVLARNIGYNRIALAEAIAATLQHVLAKRHNAVFEGYVEVFKKTREFSELSDDLVARLQSFLRFRNMLVDLPSVSSFFHLLSGR